MIMCIYDVRSGSGKERGIGLSKGRDIGPSMGCPVFPVYVGQGVWRKGCWALGVVRRVGGGGGESWEEFGWRSVDCEGGWGL